MSLGQYVRDVCGNYENKSVTKVGSFLISTIYTGVVKMYIFDCKILFSV